MVYAYVIMVEYDASCCRSLRVPMAVIAKVDQPHNKIKQGLGLDFHHTIEKACPEYNPIPSVTVHPYPQPKPHYGHSFQAAHLLHTPFDDSVYDDCIFCHS